MAKYSKLIAAVVAAAAAAGATLPFEGLPGWAQVLITSVATVVAVWRSPANEQDAPGLASDDK